MSAAAAAYRAIIEGGRIRATHEIRQVRRRQYTDERRVRFYVDPDVIPWAREIAAHRLPTKRAGLVAAVFNDCGWTTRILYLKPGDLAAYGPGSCPSEAVLPESFIPGRAALSALPFLRMGDEMAAAAYAEICIDCTTLSVLE